MKLVTFQGASRETRIGALAAEGWIVDLNAAYASYLRNVGREGAFYALADARVPSNMRGLFENGDRGLDAARTAFEYTLKEGPELKGFSGEPIFFRWEAVRIKAPIVPKKFFHTAGNFREHHEDAQKAGFCKGIDTFCPLGPYIVTADEIPDPQNLAMRLRVNGKIRQESNTNKMSVTIPEIVAHYSPMGYSAGDVLSTGTISGVAGFSEDPKSLYLRAGDIVECEIEKIGVLRNPVVSYKGLHGDKSVTA